MVAGGSLRMVAGGSQIVIIRWEDLSGLRHKDLL